MEVNYIPTEAISVEFPLLETLFGKQNNQEHKISQELGGIEYVRNEYEYKEANSFSTASNSLTVLNSRSAQRSIWWFYLFEVV